MKFLDKNTGNILETHNDAIAGQYKKYTDRYETADKNGKFPTLEKKRQGQKQETNESQ